MSIQPITCRSVDFPAPDLPQSGKCVCFFVVVGFGEVIYLYHVQASFIVFTGDVLRTMKNGMTRDSNSITAAIVAVVKILFSAI